MKNSKANAENENIFISVNPAHVTCIRSYNATVTMILKIVTSIMSDSTIK